MSTNADPLHTPAGRHERAGAARTARVMLSCLVVGCGAWETTLASLDGPPYVEITYIDPIDLWMESSEGHGIGSLYIPPPSWELRVGPDATYPVRTCADNGRWLRPPSLALSPEGALVAVRCAGTWLYFYYPGGAVLFPAGEAPLRDGEVDWAAIPPLSEAAPRLAEGYGPTLHEQLFTAIRGTEGDTGLVTALVGTVRGDDSGVWAWEEAYAGLPGDLRVVVDAALYRAIAEPGPPPTEGLLMRGLVHGVVLDPTLTAPLVARIEEALGGTITGAPIGLLVAIVSQSDPDLGASWGCRTLASTVPLDDLSLRMSVIAVARGGASESCAALDALVARAPCDASMRCPRPRGKTHRPTPRSQGAPKDLQAPLCARAQLSDLLRFPESSYEAYFRPKHPPTLARVALAAIDHLPPTAQRHDDRRLYALDGETLKEDPDCAMWRHWSLPDGSARRECLCDEIDVRQAACAAAPDTVSVKVDRCAVTIDDGQRTLLVSRGDERDPGAVP